MLPPRLAEIRARIDAKSLSERTTAERELLAELNVLDSRETLQKSLRENFSDMKSFAPLPGTCTCCGRAT